MFIVGGLALLVMTLFGLLPRVRRWPSLRDTYWATLSVVVLTAFSLALIAEGVERMGWTK